VSVALELEAWAGPLGTGVSAMLELEPWARSLGTGALKYIFLIVWGNWERNAAFGELSAQMRGTGVEDASRVTYKTRRKDARNEQPKNKRRSWLSVKSAMKVDWVKSHPRM
jgi:hypothetical protein